MKQLTLVLLVANLVNTLWCENSWKWPKPLQMGTHLIVLSESYSMDTNMAGLKWFSKKLCVTVIWMKVASASKGLTLLMLRLRSSKSQGHRDFWKPCKLCCGAIHWIALTEYFQMSTHLPGFQPFFRFLHHFVMAKLATSSIRVKHNGADTGEVTLTHYNPIISQGQILLLVAWSNWNSMFCFSSLFLTYWDKVTTNQL